MYGPKILLLLCTITPLMLSGAASAQGRLGAQSQPVNRIWFDRPSELERVSQLLNQGAKQQALEVAEEFAKSEASGQFRYESLNILCITQSANSQHEQSLDSCNKAISMRPGGWIAYNSRGGTYFAIGDFARAIDDYEKALELSPDNEVIKYNLALTQGRVGS